MNRTNEGPLFVLDANVFIEAHQRYYARDLSPGFWDCLAHYAREGRLLSIDRVPQELLGYDDSLADWVRDEAPPHMFVSSAEADVVDAFRELVIWVRDNRQFNDPAKQEFYRVADGWLIAYARVHGITVVTQEVYAPEVRKKVPIPNVCRQFNVTSTDTFPMLRELEVRFNWTP